MDEKLPNKNSYTKSYRHISEKFDGHPELYGIYSMLRDKAAWGDYVTHLRKKHATKEGEFITTIKNLTELTSKDHRNVWRELSILCDMGVITIEKRGAQCLIITNTNHVIKSAAESTEIFPKLKRDSKKRQNGRQPTLDENENGRRPTFKMGDGPLSEVRKWATAHFHEIPSSILKEEDLKKTLIEDNQSELPPYPCSEDSMSTEELAEVIPIKPKTIKKIKVAKCDSEDLSIADAWLLFATREMAWAVPPNAWNRERFAEDLYKIRKETDLNHEGLRAVLAFIEKDDFWRKNALSPGALLKKSKNDLRKIDNILLRMRTPAMRQKEKIQTWTEPTEWELNNPFG